MARTHGEPVTGDHRLAAFIRLNLEPIVAEWISFARTRTPAGDNMSRLALKDHIVEILQFIADDLETPQTAQEQVAKSRGLDPESSTLTKTAAEVHAALRLADGFDIDQMVSEYRALRASVVKQWIARNQTLAATDLEDLTRFNEAIDQAMTESVSHYTKMITHSRNLFLGILGHDLRNPIGAASMAARRLVEMGAPGSRQTLVASQIVQATARGLDILNDLLDITRSTFGMEMPVSRKRMDVGQLGLALVDEMQSIADRRTLEIKVAGDTAGQWDEARIGQVFSNLIGNAIQYSPPDSTIAVDIAGHRDHVSISVRNEGEPIPPEKLPTIFEPMKRGQDAKAATDPTPNLGLGLFIAEKIVAAHGGDLSVTSGRDSGTVFIARLPR